MSQPVAGSGRLSALRQPPRPVLTAARLMYAGACLDLLGMVFSWAHVGNSLTAIPETVIPLAGAALWCWMAISAKAGRNWARITATVLFGIRCLLTLIALAAITPLTAGAGAVLTLVILLILLAVLAGWLLGLFVIVLLWRRESSEFFAAMSTA